MFYLCPPLPLVPFSTYETYTTRRKVHTCRNVPSSSPQQMKGSKVNVKQLMIILNNVGGSRLMCYSSGDNSRSVTICSLTEHLNYTSEHNVSYKSFEEWSSNHSILTCTIVKTCKLPEEVQQIDSEVTGEKQYLSVCCAYHVMVFEVPMMTTLSCPWIDNPTVHKSSVKIVYAKLRYVIFVWVLGSCII